MKILIIDDDSTSRIILQAIVARWGYTPVTAENGEAAWEILQQEDSPKLLLLDWMMPGIDGPTLCTMINEKLNREFFYIIMLTGRGSKKDLVTGLESGADDFIGKPWDNEELQVRLKVGTRILDLQRDSRRREKLQGVLETAGAICHEMNQPMQLISGYAEMLQHDYSNDTDTCESLQQILLGVKKMHEITGKLMKITQYQTRDYLEGSSRILDLDEASRPGSGDKV